MSETFGVWLKARIEERNLNVLGLASLMGLSHASVWAWADGQTEPSVRNILKLSKVLNLPVEQIYRALGRLDDVPDGDDDELLKIMIVRLRRMTPQARKALNEMMTLIDQQSQQISDSEAPGNTD